MLVLLIGFVILFWLATGAVQFLICVAVPRLRRYALSAALWWAMWGPCSVGLMFLAGFAVVVNAFIAKDGNISLFHHPHFLESLGWGYVLLGILFTSSIASVVSWLHQAVVRRFTFALFRLYSTVVVAGIGSVFGWCFGWWILSTDVRFGAFLWLAGMTIFIGGFGVAAYRGARGLRGDAPRTLAWVSESEFEGV
jgi:hypothetical protein